MTYKYGRVGLRASAILSPSAPVALSLGFTQPVTTGMSTQTSTSKRVAIITGAAEGIGRGIALRLAKDGFDLGLFDLPRAKDRLEGLAETVKEEHGTRVVTVYGDVSQEEDVKALVERA